MDNKAIATLLYETADLLEIDGQDSFRVRSYRNAAEAIEALPQQIAGLIAEPKKILAIQGIGKGMLANLQMLFKDGRIEAHSELLKKYRPSMLELLKHGRPVFFQEFAVRFDAAIFEKHLQIRQHAFADTLDGKNLLRLRDQAGDLLRQRFNGFGGIAIGAHAK